MGENPLGCHSSRNTAEENSEQPGPAKELGGLRYFFCEMAQEVAISLCSPPWKEGTQKRGVGVGETVGNCLLDTLPRTNPAQLCVLGGTSSELLQASLLFTEDLCASLLAEHFCPALVYKSYKDPPWEELGKRR